MGLTTANVRTWPGPRSRVARDRSLRAAPDLGPEAAAQTDNAGDHRLQLVGL